MTVGMSEEDSQTLPGGEMLACFRLVVSEELAKREVGKSQAVAGAGSTGGDSLQDPERTIPGEWWALYGRSMVVAS